MPDHKRERRSTRSLRRAMWAAMLNAGDFTPRDIMRSAEALPTSVYLFIDQLLEEGAIMILSESASATEAMIYRTKWTSPNLPRCVDPVTHWQRQAWQTMRIKRRFTAADIVPTIFPDGAASRRAVMDFCDLLSQMGILRRGPRATDSGHTGSYRVYLIRKDIGPRLPDFRELQEARNRTPSEAL